MFQILQDIRQQTREIQNPTVLGGISAYLNEHLLQQPALT